MQAFAATDAAEVEAQRVQPGFLRTGRQGIDDLVAERTTHQRMRMADQCIAGLSERRGADRTWSSEAGFDQAGRRSEEHTSELQSLMRISYAVFCLKKKKDRHTV